MGALIDDDTRALYVETIGNPAVRHDTHFRPRNEWP
jgi:O-acetylhomoserine/O-acetylserine sulfhydrylase-like pyridoxal-dependent enzyme